MGIDMAVSSCFSPVAREYEPLKAGSIDGTDTKPHDHGIVRAMQAMYDPYKSATGDPKCTIFVGRISPTTDEDAVKKFFSQYGDIVRCRLVRDIITGCSKRYAFIEYSSERAASRACPESNKVYLEGYELLVEAECQRTLKGWVPRRLGGGFGGKKESGQLRFGGCDRPFRKPIDFSSSRKPGDYSGSRFGQRRDFHRGRPYSSSQRDFRRDDYKQRGSGRNDYRQHDRRGFRDDSRRYNREQEYSKRKRSSERD